MTVGDAVELYPSHACVTCNLYPAIHVHQEARVVDVWPMDARSSFA